MVTSNKHLCHLHQRRWEDLLGQLVPLVHLIPPRLMGHKLTLLSDGVTVLIEEVVVVGVPLDNNMAESPKLRQVAQYHRKE